MIIDSHTHLLQESVRRKPDKTPNGELYMGNVFNKESVDLIRKAEYEQLIETMNDVGVDKSIVMGFPWKSSKLCEENNDYVIDALNKYPNRLIGFAVVQPLDVDRAIFETKRCIDAGMIGVKLKPSWQGYSLSDSGKIDRFINYVRENGIPLFLHISQAYKEQNGDSVYDFFSFIRKHDLPLIIAAHLGGGSFIYNFLPEIKTLFSNILFDTSLPKTPEMVRLAVDSIGARKIVFGSDFPFGDQENIIEKLKSLLKQDDFKLITGENAQRGILDFKRG